MRNLVQPPPSLHCDLCNGELRLKLIETTDKVPRANRRPARRAAPETCWVLGLTRGDGAS